MLIKWECIFSPMALWTAHYLFLICYLLMCSNCVLNTDPTYLNYRLTYITKLL